MECTKRSGGRQLLNRALRMVAPIFWRDDDTRGGWRWAGDGFVLARRGQHWAAGGHSVLARRGQRWAAMVGGSLTRAVGHAVKNVGCTTRRMV
ncbi:hypothetical protein GUJ93_ZPchr0001g29259 [Zizania palustris]|uniref:Uncharacterized protein n=1 Tax=Zizania palustris TaxID=103762 RepID=A0A8J5RR79_ZIZPA|nr:hypothetical protein GUJ93_ZPchr0001g29259 [Zizania palustris]